MMHAGGGKLENVRRGESVVPFRTENVDRKISFSGANISIE